MLMNVCWDAIVRGPHAVRFVQKACAFDFCVPHVVVRINKSEPVCANA